MRFYDRLTQAVLRRPIELGLRALVGVMDHGGRPPLHHGHVQRVEDEFSPQLGGHRPADHPATPRIEDDGQIEEAGPCRDVGDVDHPELVGPGGGKVAADQIGRGGTAGSPRVVR
jgi:hypothetical protein